MKSDRITLTDAEIKALTLNNKIKPNLLCMLPDFDTAESVSSPVMDAAQQDILHTILRPMNATDIAVLFANDGLMHMQLSLRGKTEVLLGREDDVNQMLPSDEGNIATMVMAYLAQGNEPLKRAVALNLSFNAFLLLLAVADAYKMNYIEDLIHHTLSEASLTVDSLDRAVKDAYESTDLRWLLPFALFRSEKFHKLDVKAALSEFVEAGLMKAGGVVLTEEGESFIDELMYRKVIADISSLYVQDKAIARSHVMFIRTENALWGIQFNDKNATILSLTIDEACELMVSILIQKDEPKDRLAPKATKKEDPLAAKIEMSKCTKCGQKIETDAKFCQHCGTNLPKASSTPKTSLFCAHCGTKLEPNSRFCSKCGKPCE